jgi:hypothetical protein
MAAQSSHMTQHALKLQFANFYLRSARIQNAMD